MSKEKKKYINVKISIEEETIKEIHSYLDESGASVSEFIRMLISKGIKTKENDEKLCYEYGRVTPEFKKKVREKILKRFKSLGQFARMLGIDQAYAYLVFNGYRRGSPELWKRIILAVKDE